MSIWAISDLHLHKGRPSPREQFAKRWTDHTDRLEGEWRAVVKPDDLVLIPGDISMARSHREVQPDLQWLHRLPGRKVMTPGNHDRWWNNVEAVRRMLRPSQWAVEGDFVDFPDALVCGLRGEPVSEDDRIEDHPRTQRLVDRLRAMLEAAAENRGPEQPLILLWHYAPFSQGGQPGHWVDVFREFGVDVCVYGHLHQQGQWSQAVQGIKDNVRYYCVAADAIGFRPLRIDRP